MYNNLANNWSLQNWSKISINSTQEKLVVQNLTSVKNKKCI